VKILYILKKEPDNNINTIMSENEKESEVTIVDLRENQDYDVLVERIETCDRVITW
jgi:hypothetical protein